MAPFLRTILASGLLSIMSLAPIGAFAGNTPSVALLDVHKAALPAARQAGNIKRSQASLKSKARVKCAAICTEDLAQITFQEYSVDWSAWMNEVANRWSLACNSAYSNKTFKPHGPMSLEFTCNKDGSIAAIAVQQSSGDMGCDAMQVRSLANCLPLPAFPANSKKKSITLLYIWDYANSDHIAQAPRHRTKRSATELISITGKLM